MGGNLTILSITTQKPHSTGSGTYLTEIVKAWDRCGYAQGVVAGMYESDEVSFPSGVRYYPVMYTAPGEQRGDIGYPMLGMSDVMPYTSTRYMDLTLDMIAEMREAFMRVIERAVNELNPDVIVCHHLFLLTAFVREAYPDRKVVCVCHGSDLRQMSNLLSGYGGYANGHIDANLIARNIAALDGVMLLHSEQVPKATSMYGVSASRIHIIGTGYNSDVFNMCEPDVDIYDKKSSYYIGAEDRGVSEACAGAADGTEPGAIADAADGAEPGAIVGTEHSAEAGAITGAEGREIRIIYAGKICKEKGIPELLRAMQDISEDPTLPPLRLLLAGGCKDEDVLRLLASPGGAAGSGAASSSGAAASGSAAGSGAASSSGAAASGGAAGSGAASSNGAAASGSAAGSGAAPTPAESLTPGILRKEPFVTEYLGMLSQKELARAFRSADIFVLPSYYEGLPLVLIEAMATGLEVICTDLPGVRDWVKVTIPNSTASFITMPRMRTIDSPDPDFVHEFVSELGELLREKVFFCQKYNKDERIHPDTSRADWGAVADRIISNL